MNRGTIEDLFKQMVPIYDLVCKCTETQEKELLDAQERIDYQFELITSRVFIICLLQHIQCVHRHCQSTNLHHIKENIVNLIVGCYSTPIDKSPLVDALTQLVTQFSTKQENSDSSTAESKSKEDHEDTEKPLSVEAFTLRFKEATYELFRQDWDRRRAFAATVQEAVIKEIEKAKFRLPVVTDTVMISTTTTPSFAPCSIIDNQRQFLIQELDSAIESLEKDIHGIEKLADSPEKGLHELLHQMAEIKREMDESLYTSVANGSTSSLDDILAGLSSPTRKPVAAQVELHPTIVDIQTTLTDFCKSINREHDKFVEEKDVLVKEAPIKLFISTLLQQLSNSKAFVNNKVDTKALVAMDEMVSLYNEIIANASPIAENLKKSYIPGDHATKAQCNVEALADAAEGALYFLETKKRIPSTPFIANSDSVPLTTPLKTIATALKEFFNYSEDKKHDLNTLTTRLLPLSSFIASLLPSDFSEQLVSLSSCSLDIRGALKAATDSLDRLSTVIIPPLSPLLQVPATIENIDKLTVSRPVTFTTLRSFSKKYATINQLLKQLLAQLEKSKRKLLDQSIKKDEADELRREQESYSNLETETQLDKLIDNLKTTYICPTCRDELSGAFLIGCGHMACASCLYHMYETRTRKCPICQKPYKQEDIVEFAVIR